MGNFSDMTLNVVKQQQKKDSLGELRPKSVATSSQTERFPLLSEYTSSLDASSFNSGCWSYSMLGYDTNMIDGCSVQS